MQGIIKCETPQDYNEYFGLDTYHPLVSVVDFSKMKNTVLPEGWSYGFYGIFLKGSNGKSALKYGRNFYDYKEGALVFTAPYQTITLNQDDKVCKKANDKNKALLFHPELLRGTSLGKNIHKYNFFSYELYESLHLSEQERQIVLDCIRNIEIELQRGIDVHSKTLICSNIELFLNYCTRFYDRQFITRQSANLDTVSRFESILHDFYMSGSAKESGLPTVKYCADQLNISPNYLGDLIKKETGKSAQEFIQLKLIDVAKEKLFQKEKTVSQIAYELGFEYPQYFSRLFKKRVGVSPNEYRMSS